MMDLRGGSVRSYETLSSRSWPRSMYESRFCGGGYPAIVRAQVAMMIRILVEHQRGRNEDAGERSNGTEIALFDGSSQGPKNSKEPDVKDVGGV